MLTKPLLTISLLLRWWQISATAHAGSTITDKSYWPSAARQNAQTRTVGFATRFEFFFSRTTGQRHVCSPRRFTNEGGSAWRYQGGPKR